MRTAAPASPRPATGIPRVSGACSTLFVTHSVFEAVYLSQRVLVMSARPGHLVGDLVVDESYPRGAELRLSTRCAERCRAVSVALESGYGADLSP